MMRQLFDRSISTSTLAHRKRFPQMMDIMRRHTSCTRCRMSCMLKNRNTHASSVSSRRARGVLLLLLFSAALILIMESISVVNDGLCVVRCEAMEVAGVAALWKSAGREWEDTV